VGPVGALVIGLLAGCVCFFATQFIKRSLKIDDSLDVFPVHGVGGVMGTLLTGVFAAESMGGLGLQTSIGEQVVKQLTGVVATILWCGVVSLIVLLVLDKTLGLRVSSDDETEGLDLTQHNEKGYNL